jgi:hypothetical protein
MLKLKSFEIFDPLLKSANKSPDNGLFEPFSGWHLLQEQRFASWENLSNWLCH